MDRVFRHTLGNVDEIEQIGCSLQMAQKLKPQAFAFVCALNKTGDIGDHIALAIRIARTGTFFSAIADDAEMWC